MSTVICNESGRPIIKDEDAQAVGTGEIPVYVAGLDRPFIKDPDPDHGALSEDELLVVEIHAFIRKMPPEERDEVAEFAGQFRAIVRRSVAAGIALALVGAEMAAAGEEA